MSDQARPGESDEEQLWTEFANSEENGNDAPAEEAATPAWEAAEEQQAPDIWAEAPPDLKAAHEAQVKALESATSEHARRSIEGRIAAYTRRLKERNEAAAQPPAPAPEEEAANPLAELAAEYPEIATPLEKAIAPLSEKLSQFDAIEQGRQRAADAQMDADLKANEGLLAQHHPGWEGYLHEYGAVFGAWIADQPLYFREAFVTNRDAIVDPYSAIDALDAFKEFVAEHTQPSQAAPTRYAAAEPNRLNPRRAAQLAGTASPHSVGSRPTVSGIPQSGDEDQIWKAFAAIDPDEKRYRSA